MHAGFSVSSFFTNNNINTVFTLCGGHISPILVGCESEGIDIIEVRDEASTVFAADAVSRLTDSVGVAIVTAGPGVTNTITAIKNAQLAQSPLILRPSMVRRPASKLVEQQQHFYVAGDLYKILIKWP